MSFVILCADAIEGLRALPDDSVQCVVTSPPYWGLRDYGVTGQLGLEPTPDEYVARMVEVFREVRRVLRADGTLWLNLGDSYATTGRKGSGGIGNGTIAGGRGQATNRGSFFGDVRARKASACSLKDKDLVGIPWRVAFALQADSWWLRSDIVWSKPNCMPESVLDRPTRSHEYVFLLTKSARYYYDAAAIRENFVYGRDHHRNVINPPESQMPGAPAHTGLRRGTDKQRGHGRRHAGFNDRWDAMSKEEQQADGRNCRSVWTISPQPFPDAHFATFPPALVERCVKAGSREGDLVLDPFSGAGTSGLVALRLNRRYVGIDLNAAYCAMARRRIIGDAPLLRAQEPNRAYQRAARLVETVDGEG